MSLTIIEESEHQQKSGLQDLSPGTWFTDVNQQIYLTALDDRTHECRIISLGNYYQPFIVNVPMCAIHVERILYAGVLLQITQIVKAGGIKDD